MKYMIVSQTNHFRIIFYSHAFAGNKASATRVVVAIFGSLAALGMLIVVGICLLRAKAKKYPSQDVKSGNYPTSFFIYGCPLIMQ